MLSRQPSTPSEHSPETGEPVEPVYHPSKTVEEWQLIGTGDGASMHFSAYLSLPIVPGSVIVFHGRDGAIDRLGALTAMPRSDPNRSILEDRLRDGTLMGDGPGCSISYETGSLHLNLFSAPEPDVGLYVRWERKIHQNDGAKIQITLADGSAKTISMQTLRAMINLA